MSTEQPNSPHDRPALLFDLDGTLLDTPRAIAEQFDAAVATVTGKHPGVESARRLIGEPLEQMAGALSGSEPGSERAHDVAAEYLRRYRDIVVPKAADLVFPGVREGLQRLSGAGSALAIVTSKKHESAVLIVDAAGLADYFVIIGADDVAHPKPHRASADAALAALGRHTSTPADAVIGDTAADIGLGTAIGAFTVGVTYGVLSTEEIFAAVPDTVAHSFDEVTNTLLRRMESETWR